MKKIVFSHTPIALDLGLLLLRVGTSLMLVSHGWSKVIHFSERLNSFADPIGLGPAVSLQLVIFAEFFCAIFLILGFMSRIILIPMIINMAVITFFVHANSGFDKQELPLIYLLVFIVLLLLGPGKISLDGKILKKRNRY
ncbi:DoxX family protein [Cyclobacterium amurskyense]|uniref:DoxX family protein n=1 Tax=Cyclobacterium amurskyense TaxID=320787 RepID=A0A0H4PTN2_9BACT|nr:DoxX family protein [Cyclobacterium amurskyense]AKP51697.1 DoxX family protein [Cyclobacterium amurskyense]|tara:strand:- start:27561 stop:27980 length:420 start_codon:yes stop_codon:yes gene_type:complete